MSEPIDNIPATTPAQPEAVPPLKKKMPLILGLGGIVLLIGISNAASLFSGKKKDAPKSALAMRPTSTNPQQVASFQNLQTIEAAKDAEERLRQQQLAAQEQALQAQQAIPSPEVENAAPMTVAQRNAIYGSSANASQRTSNVSQAQAEAKQKVLVREKLHQDALASNTVAIDFAHAAEPVTPSKDSRKIPAQVDPVGDVSVPRNVAEENNELSSGKTDPMARYDFDAYQGRFYRVFEGTVLEGIVTNHIDGGFSGPILVMLTTDYYSHDHQQLLMPQGTRLIGSVQSVGNAGQHKLMVTFHRAVCPDGFSLDFDKFLGHDPIGTTGLATSVDHGYLMASVLQPPSAGSAASPRWETAEVILRRPLKSATASRRRLRRRASRYSTTSSTACPPSRSRKAPAPACISAGTSLFRPTRNIASTQLYNPTQSLEIS